MPSLHIKSSVWLGLYLLIMGILAVNIHIQMTRYGVSFPQWEPTKWVKFSILALQNLGVLWLSKRIQGWRLTLNFSKHLALVFVTMAALQELFIRLPLTAGYTADQQFLFIWVYSYLPEMLITLMTTLVIVAISRISWLNNKYTSILLVSIFSVLMFFLASPVLREITQPLLPYLTPPDKAGILFLPYPWQVDVIASVTFIEPMIASIFVCYLICIAGYSEITKLMIQTITALMILTQSGPKFVFYMFYSTIVSYMDRILSIAQFTLQWVFIGAVVSLAIVYLTQKQNFIRIIPKI